MGFFWYRDAFGVFDAKEDTVPSGTSGGNADAPSNTVRARADSSSNLVADMTAFED